MDLASLLGVVRRRWIAIALCVLAGLAGATAVTRSTPKRYESTAELFVSIPEASRVQDALQGTQLAQILLKSYARIATSKSAATRVRTQLGLPETVPQVQRKITATSVQDTLLIHVTAQDGSPERARDIANAAARALVEQVGTLESSNRVPVVARVVDAASVQRTPVAPRPTINAALGLFLGLLSGAALAMLLESLDRSVKVPAQAAACFNAPLLGLVPRRRDAATDPLVAATTPAASASEAYRALRTAVQFVDPDSPLRTLLVTSPSPGEGKTATAANLAIALAQSGERVILVDADLRRARLADHFGLEGAVGLTSVVTHQVDLRDALQGWRDDLAVLTSGPLPPNPAEILGSQSMSAVIEELATIADIVVFDSPPVLPVTDAVVLATQVDGVLVVGRAGRTQRNLAAEATRRLQGVGAHVIGFVLNAVPGSAARGYYADYTRQTATRVSLPRRRATDALEDRLARR
ncbi:MAG: polysaccharide biosynthesis tyrosine autokinase [Mycobacteriales bacterium]|nr:polysaccharide biosynthesis tyrosine autokinase [Frankia sp.]